MKIFNPLLPFLVVAVALIYLLLVAIPPGDPPQQMQIQAFGRLPVLDGGRVKPMDSLARGSLMVISNRQDFRGSNGRTQPAIKWLLDVMTTYTEYHRNVEQAETLHFTNPEVLDILGLEPRKDGEYKFDELSKSGFDRLVGHIRRLQDPRGQRGPNDPAIMDALKQLSRVVELRKNPESNGVAEKHLVFRIDNDQVVNLLGLENLENRPNFRYSIEDIRPNYKKLEEATARAVKKDDKQRDLFDNKVLEVRRRLERYLELAQEMKPKMVPPSAAHSSWQTLAEARKVAEETDEKDPNVQSLQNILLAYANNQPAKFNEELATYQQRLKEEMPSNVRNAKLEAEFNHFQPFVHCMYLYVCVVLLAVIGWLMQYRPLNRAAFALAIVTLIVHTGALLVRMSLQGRPPVTNLYSSAVFIGWGCLVLALFLEGIYRNGIGNVVGGVTGFLTVFIAHHLASSGEGDTMEMMQAVLDTNFWLATHVTCVTLGYTATFFAGFLGILFIAIGVLTPRMDKDLFQTLGQMIYGVVSFATLLSFVGTVLGGIWADQSWGRFWGWDPKENGALLIVVWNALILHARWAGLVKQRGMALLAVAGNMVTGWSWFGTNQLGVGLHAYGFNNTLAMGLTFFWLFNLGVIVVGLIPQNFWWSTLAQREAARLKAVGESIPTRGGRERERSEATR